MTENDSLQDHILKYLSSLDIQFKKVDPDVPDKCEIVIYRASDQALATLEAYFRKNNVSCESPAGPVRSVDKDDADRLQQLLTEYKEKGWITTTPVPQEELDRIDYEYLIRNIIGFKVIGKTNVGWKVECLFDRDHRLPSLELIGKWSKTNNPDRYQFYFRDEGAMNSLVSKLGSNCSIHEH